MARACLLFVLALVPRALGGTSYKVTYTTGSHVEAGSEAPMFLKLFGYLGSSPFVKLGDSFTQDVTKTVQITFPNDVGPLTGISVKAGSEPPFDSWNAVNFINIEDGSGQVAQFNTAFTLSGQPKTKLTDYGIYEELSEVYASRTNHAATLPHPLTYYVSLQTGRTGEQKAGTTSHHFMQFVGTRARSRYYDMCELSKSAGGTGTDWHTCFEHGQKQAMALAVSEDIGLLTGVSFLAGGADAWQIIDFVNVMTPSHQQIQFPANFWLDSSTYVTKPADFGIYPHAKTKQLSAINIEERGVLQSAEQCPTWMGTLSHGTSAPTGDKQGAESVCCPRSCGTCGGEGCALRPGGADKCCHKSIVESQNVCTVHNPPCMVAERGYKYKIQLTTGSVIDAGTTGRIWVQMRGQRGKTNFHVVQHHGLQEPGKTFTVSYNSKYNIGDVTGITLQASGEDGWYVDGKIVIMANKYRYTADAGWWIDMQPNENGENYLGLPHGGVHTFYNMKRESYAAAIGVHGPMYNAKDSYGGAGSGKFTGLQPQAHVADDTAGTTPTPADWVEGQSKGNRWCMNGNSKVEEGWWGKGDGHNSCNDCRCLVNPEGDAIWKCTSKSCGIYWRSEFYPGAIKCPKHHLECDYGKGEANTRHAGRHRLRVKHHVEGQRLYAMHRCGYDALHPNKPCTCICYNPTTSAFPAFQHADALETMSLARPKSTQPPSGCEWVKYSSTFDQRASDVVMTTNARVIISAMAQDQSMEPVASNSWVQATHDDRFEACITGTSVASTAATAAFSYFAFDRTVVSESLLTGYYTFTNPQKDQTSCDKVYFTKNLPDMQFIAGSVEIFSGEFHNEKQGVPVWHWIRGVHADHFEACAHPATELADHERIYFNYMAAGAERPAAENQRKLYTEAGKINIGDIAGPECKQQTFTGSYKAEPNVLLAVETATDNTKPLNAYLKDITASSFTACVHMVGDNVSLRGIKLHWVAIGTDVPEVTMKTV